MGTNRRSIYVIALVLSARVVVIAIYGLGHHTGTGGSVTALRRASISSAFGNGSTLGFSLNNNTEVIGTEISIITRDCWDGGTLSGGRVASGLPAWVGGTSSHCTVILSSLVDIFNWHVSTSRGTHEVPTEVKSGWIGISTVLSSRSVVAVSSGDITCSHTTVFFVRRTSVINMLTSIVGITVVKGTPVKIITRSGP